MTSVVPNLTPPKKCHPERSASGAPIAGQCDGGKRSEGSASCTASIRTKNGCPVHSRSLRMGGKARHSSSHRRGAKVLYRLRKNSSQERFLKGHEFTRADKSIGLTPALAAEGGISQFFPELFTFSAARLGLGKVSSNAKAFRPGPNHPHLLL